MKKTFTVIGILSLLGFTTSQLSYAANTLSSASAEASMVSGLVVLSATVAPLMFFEELSKTNKPLKIQEVENNGNKSKIKCVNGKEKIELQVDKKLSDKLELKSGMDVNVKKNSMGYTLDVDNKVLGVVTNTNDFKVNKLN
jgi:hypothetical protein